MALSSARVEALERLAVETRRLFRSLRRAADELHEATGWHTAARRSVLVELLLDGPRTVPALAAARHVSRQDVQGRMDRLEGEGLVERRPNPRHRRSPLFALTPRGRAAVRRLLERERAHLAIVAAELDTGKLDDAGRTLAAVREALDAGSSST